MSRFKDRQLQHAYEVMLRTPPTRGGCVMSDAYFAGYAGRKGILQGVPTSLQRAAWTAGRDAAKAQPAPTPER